jgi:hydrogenase-4 component B
MTASALSAALPAALVIRLAVVALTLSCGHRPRLARRLAFAGAAVASGLTGAAAAAVLYTGSPSHGTWLVHGASGLSLTYAVDGLSAWFLMVLAGTAIPVAVFSLGYFAHPHYLHRSTVPGAAFNVLLGAMEMVFTADDAITFLFAWELMTLATAALVATEHERRPSRRAAFLYLAMSHVGTGCLIAGFLTLAAASGSIAFPVALAGAVPPGRAGDVLFVLFLIGFGVKAGVIPFHVWLPEAHPAAPSSISALMSAVVIKSGIYGLIRVCAFGLGVPRLSWSVLMLSLGAVSAVLGVLYALMQHDLKRLLAYHSIENIGIILLGLGAGMMALAYGRPDVASVGISASLYHVLNHAVFKGLLFLGVGGIAVAAGTRQIERLGGLLRRMPWTGLFFLVGAMAISGLPPLNGFASEWLTFQAFLFGFRGSDEPLVHLLFPLAAAVLALTTALAAACFVKAFGISFLALPRSAEAATAVECGPTMLAPQAFLALLCAALGLFPGSVVGVLEGVMGTLPGLQPAAEMAGSPLAMASGLAAFDTVVPMIMTGALAGGMVLALALVLRSGAVRRVPTWGCGGQLTPETEYSATAFSKPLMMIFRAVYRPTREVEALAKVSPYYPQEVRYRAQIEPTFERFVYGPLVRVILGAANGMKVLQAGSLHAYLAYVLALVLTLVLSVWWRQ